MSKPFRYEEELLLCCSRMRLDKKMIDEIRAILAQSLDWDYVLKIAASHGVLPLLYQRLKTSAQGVPSKVMESLSMAYISNARHNLLAIRELMSVLRRFDEEGIPIMPFKGPVLAQQVYGDIALRVFSDLDLIVPENCARKARHLLASMGYLPDKALAGGQEELHIKTQYDYHLYNQRAKLMIEVHWRILQSSYCLPFEAERIWSNSVKFSFERMEILSLSPEDLLMALCIHGTKHHWESLKLVADVAWLIGIHENIDWENLEHSARTLGAERILHLGLLLSEDLLVAGIPEGVLSRAREDKAAGALASQVCQRLFAERYQSKVQKGSIFEHIYFWIKARERPRDRLCCIIKSLAEPTSGDWEVLPLPRALYPLYYIIRPFKLAVRYGIGIKEFGRAHSARRPDASRDVDAQEVNPVAGNCKPGLNSKH